MAAHMVQRYGMEMVSTWYWEMWNEPNGRYYWKGTEDEYNQLYDYAVAGVRQAIPDARVGGPATTGPGPRATHPTICSFFSLTARPTRARRPAARSRWILSPSTSRDAQTWSTVTCRWASTTN